MRKRIRQFLVDVLKMLLGYSGHPASTFWVIGAIACVVAVVKWVVSGEFPRKLIAEIGLLVMLIKFIARVHDAPAWPWQMTGSEPDEPRA